MTLNFIICVLLVLVYKPYVLLRFTRPKKEFILKSLTLIFITLFIAGCDIKIGDDAIALMSQEQKNIVAVAKKFSATTTTDDITKILGRPYDKGVAGVNPQWNFKHGDHETRLKAYFISGSLDKVQYTSLDPLWGYSIYYDSDDLIQNK